MKSPAIFSALQAQKRPNKEEPPASEMKEFKEFKRGKNMKQKIKLLAISSIFLLAAILLINGRGDATAGSSAQVTYVVTTDDDHDDGLCRTDCTLREAINAANDNPGLDTIVFHIEPDSGDDFVTILPDSELPPITDPIVIDGATDQGVVGLTPTQCASTTEDSNMAILLNGIFAGSGASGLTLNGNSDGSTIQGLAIIQFDEIGIEVNSTNNHIRCNHIGANLDGFDGTHGNHDRPGNGDAGIWLSQDGNMIGGEFFSDRNVISDNGGSGVVINANSDSNIIQSNFIGVAADGVTPLGNYRRGITIHGDTNLIGGIEPRKRNVISANLRDGIWTDHENAVGNSINNNYIGVDRNGAPLGNAENGIYFHLGSENLVGDRAPNLIAYNGQNGVRVGVNSAGNTLDVNEIRDNAELGIDLEKEGEQSGDITLNDPLGDLDVGGNRLQNFPNLTSADVIGNIEGSFQSTPGNYFISFYSNESCPGGYGEGETFIETIEISVPESQPPGPIIPLVPVSIDILLTQPLTAGDYIVATATRESTGDTSEFSACVQVTEATFVVNSVDDTTDNVPGDGVCEVNQSSNVCTLRAAITELNASPGLGPFRIAFDIPGNGPHRIMPPVNGVIWDDIEKPVVIDGLSQPDSACPTIDPTAEIPYAPANLQIILDGSNLGAGNGLTLVGGSRRSEVRGLVIGGFPGHGIAANSQDNVIACNHIGVTRVGAADFGNGANGINVNAEGNTIGGASLTERNVISGNALNGVRINDDVVGSRIRGNLIGTNAIGTAAIPNDESGILIQGATDNIIGGLTNATGNLISGNGLAGIALRTQADSNLIWGNDIGTGLLGLSAIPNQVGILIVNSDSNQVGGDQARMGNVVSGNSEEGIFLEVDSENTIIDYNRVGLNSAGAPLGNGASGIVLGANVTGTEVFSNTIGANGANGVQVEDVRNPIRFNQIYLNGELGIDLNNDGLTNNDLGDVDTGGNDAQNFPMLFAADLVSGTITFTLSSTPSDPFVIDFYKSPQCDSPDGHGEGAEYLGEWPVLTNANGIFAGQASISGFSDGDVLTATATDQRGNTSEFSRCFTVVAPNPPVFNPSHAIFLPISLKR